MLSRTLENLADIVLEMDAKDESADFVYSDDDVIYALMIFNSIVCNKFIHRMLDKDMDASKMDKSITKHAKNIKKFFTTATGVDPIEYFKSLR